MYNAKFMSKLFSDKNQTSIIISSEKTSFILRKSLIKKKDFLVNEAIHM